MNQWIPRVMGWTFAAGMALSAGVVAQAPAPSEADDKPALSGPRVEEKKIPGVESRFGGAGGDWRAMVEGRLPADAMRRLIGALRGDQVPVELRLTTEQDERIAAIEAEHRRAIGEYLREHRAELDEIRAAMGNERFARMRERLGGGRTGEMGPGRDRPQAGQAPAAAERDTDAMMAERRDSTTGTAHDRATSDGGGEMSEEAARARMIEVFSGMPRPAEAGNRVWNVLTEGQQKWVEQRLEAARTQTDRRMTEEYARRLMDARNAEDSAKPKAPDPVAVPLNEEMIPVRLRERLAALPEEERARIVSVIRDRIERGEWNPEAMRRLRDRLDQAGKEKPAPGMDTVKVPPPDSAGR